MKTRPLLGLLTALILVACGGCAGESADADDPVTLFLPTGTFERSMLPILDAFTKETGIKVEPIAVPAEDARSRQVLDMNTGKGDVDLVLLDDTAWMGEVVHNLQPLDDRIKSDDVKVDGYIPALLDIFESEGKQYAFPLGLSSRSLIYRADLFEKEGLEPPKTWQQFYDYAERFTKGDMYGFAGPWGRTTTYVSVWQFIARNYGLDGVIDEKAKKPLFNSEAGIAAGELMVDLYRKKLMPPDSIEFDHDATVGAMRKGRAAMAILPSTYIPELNKEDASPYAGEFKYALAPTLNSGMEDSYVVTGWGYGLSKISDNQDNAWELMKYLNKKFQTPGDDATKEQLRSPNSEAAFAHPMAKEIFPDGQEKLVKEALGRGHARHGIPEWVEIENLIADVLSRAFLGKTTVAKGFAEIDPKVRKILAES
ncbi:MAG: extracellular solute-binding protein [Streptosporangiales bacterium]|nr:extracellular solute-binding protein [Streptosporangiales bacterium]